MINRLFLLLFICSSTFLYCVQETEKIERKIKALTSDCKNPNLLDLLSHYASISGNVNPQASKNSVYIQETQKCVEKCIDTLSSQNLDTLKYLLMKYEQKTGQRYIFYPSLHNVDKKI